MDWNDNDFMDLEIKYKEDGEVLKMIEFIKNSNTYALEKKCQTLEKENSRLINRNKALTAQNNEFMKNIDKNGTVIKEGKRQAKQIEEVESE